MRFFKLIFCALLTILGIVFIIHNLDTLNQPITLKFNAYFHTFQSAPLTLWVLLLFVFFLGVLTASLYGVYEVIRQRHISRQLRHSLEVLSNELKGLKTKETIGSTEATSPI
jgi:uncharacterized integral membrane protein